MPGPEAAGATPPPPTSLSAPEADVIDLHARALARNSSRQDATMAATSGRPADPEGEMYAVEAQAIFRSQGMTLLDKGTADAFRVALALALNAVDGARAKGHITEDAHQRIRGTLLAAQRAPDCL